MSDLCENVQDATKAIPMSNEEIAFAVEQRNRAIEYSVIAKRLNRTVEELKAAVSKFKGEDSKDLTRPWTPEDEQLLYHMRRRGVCYRLIALQLSRTVEACKKKYSSTHWSKTPYYNLPLEKLEEARKQNLIESMAQAADRKLDLYKMKGDIVGDKIAESVKPLQVAKYPIYTAPKSKQKHNPEDVVALLSDLHIGHHHTLEETGGLSEFNIDIFRQRCKNLMYGVADIFDLHSNLYRMPHLHIACLGDVVDGMNASGDWSPTYISIPVMDQMMVGTECLAEMIYYWLGMFDNITFYGVRGNHGRAAPKGYEKDYVNWDVLSYLYLEARFKDNPRVKFVVPKTWYIYTTIRKHKFLMVHGDDVRGGSYPVKGLEAVQNRMVGILNDIPHYTLAGHFHACSEFTTNTGKIIINGSFIGGDVYSLKTLQKGSLPEQKIFGVHDQHGVTWTYNLNVASPRKARK